MISRREAVTALEGLRDELDREVSQLELRHAGELSCRRGCAACCIDDLSVFEVEAELIRAHHAELLAEGAPAPDGRCAFLDGQGSCRIYEDRPYVCRTQGLPLRWLEETDDAEIVEQRDVCALSLKGAAAPPARGLLPEQLPAEDCWLLGPHEDRLARLQISLDGGALRRVRLRSLFVRLMLVLIQCAGLGCGSARAPATPIPAARSTSPSGAKPPAAVVAAPSSTPSAAPTPIAPAADETREAPGFPPPRVTPPHPPSARPGDGEWRRLGSSSRGDRAGADPALLFTTVIHPHRVSRYKTLTVVVIDLARARLGYSPGTMDLADAKRKAAELRRAAGLVPAAELDKLVAVMNGGFKPRHGRWGMLVDGVELVPPRPEGCTLLIAEDGRVELATYSELARTHPELTRTPPTTLAYRQTPPCLVERGVIHPRLEAGDDRPWGGHDPKIVTRRRSAVGIDASGALLFYGMGEELEPAELAYGMRTVGASSAAQLDINWSWTRFLLFGTRPGADRLEVTSTLIPKMVHERTGYVDRPSDRDFFFVLRR